MRDIKIKRLSAVLLVLALAVPLLAAGKSTVYAAAKPAAPVMKNIVYNKNTQKTQLTWEKVSGASGYEIYYSVLPCKNFKKLATVAGGQKTSYSTKKLMVGTYFQIRAYKTVNKKNTYSAFSCLYDNRSIKEKIEVLPVTDDSLTAAQNLKFEMDGLQPALTWDTDNTQDIWWYIKFYDQNNCLMKIVAYHAGADATHVSYGLGDVDTVSRSIRTITVTSMKVGEDGSYGNDSYPAGPTVKFKCDLTVNARLQSAKVQATKKNPEESSDRWEVTVSKKFKVGLPYEMNLYGYMKDSDGIVSSSWCTGGRTYGEGIAWGPVDKARYQELVTDGKGALVLSIMNNGKVTGDTKATVNINRYIVNVK